MIYSPPIMEKVGLKVENGCSDCYKCRGCSWRDESLVASQGHMSSKNIMATLKTLTRKLENIYED